MVLLFGFGFGPWILDEGWREGKGGRSGCKGFLTSGGRRRETRGRTERRERRLLMREVKTIHRHLMRVRGRAMKRMLTTLTRRLVRLVMKKKIRLKMKRLKKSLLMKRKKLKTKQEQPLIL